MEVEAVELLCSVPTGKGVPARPPLLPGFLHDAKLAVTGTLAAAVASALSLNTKWRRYVIDRWLEPALQLADNAFGLGKFLDGIKSLS